MCPEKSLIQVQLPLKHPEKLTFKILCGFGGLYYTGYYFSNVRRDLNRQDK